MKNVNIRILSHRLHLFLFLQYGKKIFRLILDYIYILYIYIYVYIYIYIYIYQKQLLLRKNMKYEQEYAVLPQHQVI